MKKTKKIKAIIFSLFVLTTICAQSPNEVLWYDYPAADWKTQALHLGNGYMGVSFYGSIQERFDITEKTFWTGGPGEYPDYNYGIIPGGAEHIVEIRDAIVREDIKTADRLASKYMVGDGKGFGAFSTVGKLFLDFENNGDITAYRRSLDLAHSQATVEYSKGDVSFKRTYFCSYPDRVFVIRLTANKPKQLSFALRHEMTHNVDQVVVTGKSLDISGKIKGNGMKYSVALSLEQKGGYAESGQDYIRINQADEVVIYYTVITEYRSDAPLFRGGDPVKETQSIIRKVSKAGYDQTEQKHIADYSRLFQKTVLNVAGNIESEKLPTNKRWELLKNRNTDDSGLKVLLYNLGKYLLISASRPGTLPSNLQGVWNTFESAPWNGNYQSNINLQMMYWGCGAAGLASCQEAYNNWISLLVEPGRKVAKSYYGTKGWVSHSTGNPWMYTAPGGDILWGLFPSGATWHCRSMWDYYQYTSDIKFLEKKAYPIMKEAALFCLENLVEFKGQYIIAPTVSAEHGIELNEDGAGFALYSTSNGESGRNKIFCAPAFQDIQMVDDLFTNVSKAAKILGTDFEFANRIDKARTRLMPQKTGKYGQLQEWYYDVDNPRDHHRHIAHLYSLFPADKIPPAGELADAARMTLNMRGEGFYGTKWPHAGGNWSSAWRIWMWTRLGDGERADKIFNHMISNVGFENLMGSQSNNMQVDASMSVPGFISEMLLQSHLDRIYLLPALPVSLSTGEIKGIVARGGYIIDMKWKDMNLTEITIHSLASTTCPVHYKGKDIIIETNQTVRFN